MKSAQQWFDEIRGDLSVADIEAIQQDAMAPYTPYSPRPKNVEEVVTKGAFIGVSEADCRAWYADCEACGWRRGDGTLFDNWPRQLVIHRDQLRSRKPVNGNSAVAPLATRIKAAEELLKATEEKLAKIPLPDRELYPFKFADAKLKRAPLVRECNTIRQQLELLRKEALK